MRNYENMVLRIPLRQCGGLLSTARRELERLFNAYLLKTISIRDTGVRKAAKDNFYHGNLAAGCEKALEQIAEMGYEAKLLQNGMSNIIKFGIACNRKTCKAAVRKDETNE